MKKPLITYFNIFPNITEAELKRQYHEYAKVEHPDKFESLGEAAVAAAKLKFQDINTEYNAEMIKIKFPHIKIVDSKMWGGARAGADAILLHLGLTRLDDLYPDAICKFIDMIKLPAFQKHKPMAKLFIKTWAPKVDDIATVIFDVFSPKQRK